jgi:hypothetical protein
MKCTYNKGITHYHHNLKDAESYLKENGIDTLIWESGEDNPNPEYVNPNPIYLKPPTDVQILRKNGSIDFSDNIGNRGNFGKFGY